MIPTVVMINGSFGVGKTSVARGLKRRIAGSAIYDPEWAGLVIQRLPSWIHLSGRGTDDFQDVDLWRSSVVAGIRLFRGIGRGPVLAPMTFSRLDYLTPVLSGIRSFEPQVRVFCLVATLETIRKRLHDRGTPVGASKSWLSKRTMECVRAHEDPSFGERLDTEGRSITDVVEEMLARLQRPA
jgi:hypothetical protein